MPGTLSTITSVFPPERAGPGGGDLGRLRGRRRHARHARRRLDARPLTRGPRSSTSPPPPRPPPSPPSWPSCPTPGRASTWASTRSARSFRRSPSARLVLGIIEGPIHGWSDPLTVTALIAGIVLERGVRRLGAAHRAPTARPSPLPPSRLRHRLGVADGALHRPVRDLPRRSSSTCSSCSATAPSKAAVALLPMTFVMIPISTVAAPLSMRFGQKLVGGVGPGDQRGRPRGSSRPSTRQSGYTALLIAEVILGRRHRAGHDAGDQCHRQPPCPPPSREWHRRSTTRLGRSARRWVSPSWAACSTAATGEGSRATCRGSRPTPPRRPAKLPAWRSTSPTAWVTPGTGWRRPPGTPSRAACGSRC